MPKNKTLLFVFKYSPVRSIKMQARFVCMRAHTHTHMCSVPYSMRSAVADQCKFSLLLSYFNHTYTYIEIRDIRNNLKQRECQEAKFFLKCVTSSQRLVFKLVREEQISLDFSLISSVHNVSYYVCLDSANLFLLLPLAFFLSCSTIKYDVIIHQYLACRLIYK